MTNVATTLVKTRKASGYLQQLCKHFGHKTQVEFTPDSGCISFSFGRADLAVEPEGLRMEARATSVDDLERLQHVLASHLERFAFREDLTIDWRL